VRGTQHGSASERERERERPLFMMMMMKFLVQREEKEGIEQQVD